MGCSIIEAPEKDDEIFPTFVAGEDYNLMLSHVAMHRKNGDYLPIHVEHRLVFDRDCEHFYVDSKCKHCWKPQDV